MIGPQNTAPQHFVVPVTNQNCLLLLPSLTRGVYLQGEQSERPVMLQVEFYALLVGRNEFNAPLHLVLWRVCSF